jgi:hypothetical protein
MNRMIAAVSFAALALSACTALPDVKGPFARAAVGAPTRTDAVTDEVQQRPFPQATDHGLF